MDAKHKDILKRHRLLLATELIGDEVFQYLVEKSILSDHLIEKIKSKSTDFNQNIEFLTLLPKRGPLAFSHFIDALHASEQSHLASTLVECSKYATEGSSIQGDISATIASSLRMEQFSSSSDNHTAAVTSFNFSPSKPSSCNKSSSMKRHVTENRDCIVNVNISGQLPIKRSCDNALENNQSEAIPSPCGPLDDILCTSPIDSLISLSCVKYSHLSSNNLANKKSAISDLTPSENVGTKNKNVLNCDLADGPHLNDLIVRTCGRNIQECHFYDCYPIKSSRCGLALIISVEHFEACSHLDNRQASEVDRARLEFVLRQLGFKCYLLVDGTAEEIWNVLEKFVTLEDHYDMDASMLVAMSHGEEGCFFGRDGKPVYIDKIINLFNNVNFKSLHHKPKVLLFQSCRGNLPDPGVIDASDGPHRPKVITAPEADLSSSRPSLDAFNNKLPTHSDCLIGFATVKGYAAMRNTQHGSWYIQALVRVLAYHACDKHLVEIMTIVNRLIKDREGNSSASAYHRCKEMSIFHSTFCKKLYLFPTS